MIRPQFRQSQPFWCGARPCGAWGAWEALRISGAPGAFLDAFVWLRGRGLRGCSRMFSLLDLDDQCMAFRVLVVGCISWLLRVAKLEKDVSQLKKIDHSVKALTTIKSQVPTPAPESSKIQKPTIDLEQEYEKSASEIRKIKREQAEKQKMPKYTIKSTDKATLEENHKRLHDDDDDDDDDEDSSA
ncbi:hypothetical protein Tco_0300254 [Tanacetum coccineum]